MKKEGDLSRSAIMLLAFGGPRSLDEVAAFVERLTGKKPSPVQIEGLQGRYQAIGGGSPLPETTMRQARALEKVLQKKGKPLPIFVGMRYSHPLIAEALEEIRKRGITGLILISLSPYRTAFASEGYYDEVKRIVAGWSERMELIEVDDWHALPALCAAWAAKIAEMAGSISARDKEIPVIFTAHSLPQEVAAGSSYVRQLEETIEGIIHITGPLRWRLAFQSRSRGGGAWLGPEPETCLEELAAEGHHKALICPIGFIADHLETLYDLDIVLKAWAHKRGIEIARTSCLNDAPELIEVICQLVEEAVEGK
jgi:protoporphyrin/coproporphyrin ferrochelatase